MSHSGNSGGYGGENLWSRLGPSPSSSYASSSMSKPYSSSLPYSSSSVPYSSSSIPYSSSTSPFSSSYASSSSPYSSSGAYSASPRSTTSSYNPYSIPIPLTSSRAMAGSAFPSSSSFTPSSLYATSSGSYSSPSRGGSYGSLLSGPGKIGTSASASNVPALMGSVGVGAGSRYKGAATSASLSLGSSLASLGSLRSFKGSEGYGSGSNLSERGTGSIRSNRDRSYGGLSTTTSAPPSVAGDSRPPSRGQENGEIDYKKLYEEAMVENERLKERLRKADDELSSSRSQLDKALQMNSARNSLSDVDKREKRALERKLSEMEEELKQLQKLKAENEKLKAENRALTRVVSKLTSNQSVTATKAEENGKDDSPQ